MEQQKKVIDPRDWAALVQQDPISEEGAYFKASYVQYYDDLPKDLTYFGASDYAVSAGKGDYTVHGVIGVDQHEDIYIMDWWRGREDPEIWIDVMLDLMDRHETLKWAEESGQILRSLDTVIERRMEERRVWGVREQYSSLRDKGGRARAFQSLFNRKKVYFPRNKPWAGDIINEMAKFTGNHDKHDDQVDVLSLFGRMLRDLRGRFIPTLEEEKPLNHGEKIIDLLDVQRHRRRYA